AGDTVDPLGGSYAIEALTSAVEARARVYLEAIDKMGGTVKAIEAGYQEREIKEAAYRHQQAVERQEAVIVGVNRFADGGEGAGGATIPIQKIDPGSEEEQRSRLAAFKRERDSARAAAGLAEVERAARGGENLMPPILEAVERRATLGEIADRQRAVFGVYRAAASA